MLKVDVISNFRKFKKGDTFEFDVPITVIVGENGSGKSSLIHAIRGMCEKKSKKDSGSLFKSDYKLLATNIKVESDCAHFLFLDSIKDDGSNMNNAYDAVSFIDGGGFHTQKMSHGETQLYNLSKLIKKIEKIRETSEEKIMIILDEFDKGFSLSNQAKVVNVLTNIGRKFNAQIICISHNYLLISKMKFVYDLDTRSLVTPQKYLEKFTV